MTRPRVHQISFHCNAFESRGRSFSRRIPTPIRGSAAVSLRGRCSLSSESPVPSMSRGGRSLGGIADLLPRRAGGERLFYRDDVWRMSGPASASDESFCDEFEDAQSPPEAVWREGLSAWIARVEHGGSEVGWGEFFGEISAVQRLSQRDARGVVRHGESCVSDLVDCGWRI